MKLKKTGFVKITEQNHKLSIKYKFTDDKLRAPDKKDKKIVKKISNFISNLNYDTKNYSGEWKYLNKFKRTTYLNSLFKNDKKKLLSGFSNLFRKDCTYGMVTPSYQDLKNKKKIKSKILQDIDASIEFSNLKYSNQINLNKNIGNPFGIIMQNKVIMPDAPRHFYFANKINYYAKKKNNFKLLEIGGGYGGLMAILSNFNKNITYYAIDLTESCFIQYYFLKKLGFKVNLINKIKDIKKKQINLILFEKDLKILKKIGKCDFVFNSRSFSEMSKDVLNKYINVINNYLKPSYILHENSNYLLFPKSRRHIEILGKDFIFNKKKYNLEYINISPFSGGSGRYREFFYKKI